MADKIIELYIKKFGTKDDDGNEIVYEHNGGRYITLGNCEYNVDDLTEEESRHLIKLIREW